MKLALLLVCLSPLLLVFFPQGAFADIIVVANRTIIPLKVEIKPAAGAPFERTLQSRDVLPLFLDGRADIAYTFRGEAKQFQMDANCVYFFTQTAENGIELRKIGLGENSSTSAGRDLPNLASAPAAVIPVKILVDDDEPAKQLLWERRIRQRVETASDILEQTCRVKLKIVAVEKWDTDDKITEFFDSLS